MMYIQLRNPTEVMTEWSMKKEDLGSSNEGVCEASPNSGALQPGEFCNIQVSIPKQLILCIYGDFLDFHYS